MPLFQDSNLLMKGQIFQEKIAAGTKESNSQNEQKPQQAQHEPVVAEGRLCIAGLFLIAIPCAVYESVEVVCRFCTRDVNDRHAKMIAWFL